MATRDTDNESDFEYEGKTGYINTCEIYLYSKEELGKVRNYLLNFVIVDRVVDFFYISFLRARMVLINI